jgi:hypothetical protein
MRRSPAAWLNGQARCLPASGLITSSGCNPGWVTWTSSTIKATIARRMCRDRRLQRIETGTRKSLSRMVRDRTEHLCHDQADTRGERAWHPDNFDDRTRARDLRHTVQFSQTIQCIRRTNIIVIGLQVKYLGPGTLHRSRPNPFRKIDSIPLLIDCGASVSCMPARRRPYR